MTLEPGAVRVLLGLCRAAASPTQRKSETLQDRNGGADCKRRCCEGATEGPRSTVPGSLSTSWHEFRDAVGSGQRGRRAAAGEAAGSGKKLEGIAEEEETGPRESPSPGVPPGCCVSSGGGALPETEREARRVVPWRGSPLPGANSLGTASLGTRGGGRQGGSRPCSVSLRQSAGSRRLLIIQGDFSAQNADGTSVTR